MNKSAVILLAAGAGTRMGIPDNKCLMPLNGRSVMLYSLSAFKEAGVDYAVIVAAQDEMEVARAIVCSSSYRDAVITAGGSTRQQSVCFGMQVLPEDVDTVLIHDGARPFVTADIIRNCLRSVAECGTALTAVPATDTIKMVEDGCVEQTLNRDRLFCAQTPQAFDRKLFERAQAYAMETGFTGTDDASLVEHMGEKVRVVPGDQSNIKLTTPQDLYAAYALLRSREQQAVAPGSALRIGQGYDVHALHAGRPLILGGVGIPSELGLNGHSDADVLSHAIIDALLGAAGLGDIGTHFPDTDKRYKDANSLGLLCEVNRRIRQVGYRCVNCDATVVLQSPKIAPYIADMRENIAQALGMPCEAVSIKATTTERLGFEGAQQGASAQAVALLSSREA